jgi:cell division protein FtsW (lipid II flippase)
MQTPIASQTLQTVSHMLAARKRSETILFLLIFIITLSMTPVIMIAGLSFGMTFVLGVVIAIILAGLVVRWPVIGFFVVATCVVLVEQDALSSTDFTDRLYVFYWPTKFEGLPERPLGFLILFIFLVIICGNLLSRKKILRGGDLGLPFLLFMVCVIWGVVHGIISGGSFKIIVLEVRPFLYLFEAYFLAYNLISKKNQIRAFFWVVIFGAGVKSLQGLYLYLIVFHADLVDHHEIMAHEESFFFISLLLLVVLFVLHHCYRPQFFVALAISPCVIIAMVANQRRADYVAFLLGVAVAWILVFWVKPQSRKKLVVGMIIFLIIGTAYVLAFQHGSGSFSEPARSIVSIFKPNADSTSYYSNLYRDIEDYDLKYTVRLNPMGMGFGKQFLQPEILPNIITLDPYYLYIPHNTVYWVWMRLGPFGYAAFWYLIGAAVIRGCLIARKLKDSYLQLVAIYVVAVIFMEISVAYADYQLYFYRNVIFLGLLLGMLMLLPKLDAQKETINAKASEETNVGTKEVITI